MINRNGNWPAHVNLWIAFVHVMGQPMETKMYRLKQRTIILNENQTLN